MIADDFARPSNTDISDVLSASALFAGVAPVTLRQMAPLFAREFWPKGRTIGSAKDYARRFRLIARGRVKISRTNGDDAREITLWLLGPGDAFDVVSLLDGEPHEVAACALEDVETLAVPLRVFERWMERSESLRLAIHRYVARQLREITDLAGDLALHDTTTRLARLLLRHFETGAADRGARSNLIRGLPQSELAAMIGSVRVVVSRLVAALKRERVVDLRDGMLHALDVEGLLQHAEAKARGAGRDERRRTVT